MANPLVVFILANFFYLTILIERLPFSFTISSVDNTFHTFLATFKKVFPHTIIRAFKKNTPHFQLSGLVKKFPHARGLIVGELALRFDVSVEVIGYIAAVKDIFDGILYLIDLLDVFPFRVVVGLAHEALCKNREAAAIKNKKLSKKLLTTSS